MKTRTRFILAALGFSILIGYLYTSLPKADTASAATHQDEVNVSPSANRDHSGVSSETISQEQLPTKSAVRLRVFELMPPGSTILDDGQGSGQWVALLQDGTRIEASGAKPTSGGITLNGPIKIIRNKSTIEFLGETATYRISKNGEMSGSAETIRAPSGLASGTRRGKE